MKKCSRCGEIKNINLFVTKRSRPDGVAAHCRECHSKATVLVKYGITAGEFELRLKEQGYVCALCRRGDWGGRGRKPSVDHSHMTGRVRGLLCNWCNSDVIGLLEAGGDVQARLRSGFDYIANASFQIIDKQRKYPGNRLKVTKKVQYVGFKQCRGKFGCGVWKPVKMFQFMTQRLPKITYNTHCYSCERFVKLWLKYRLTREEYNELWRHQDGKCRVCGVLEAGNIQTDNLLVDHSGDMVRGLLCDECNRHFIPALERVSEKNRAGYIERVLIYLDR